jgi:4-hydroxythreonine-4-phosphate dehydrogenase
MRQDHKHKPVIGISIGDVNGIGLEVIIKTFADPRMLQFCTPVIYGSLSVINYHRKAINAQGFNFQQIRSIDELQHRKVNLLNCWEDNVRINFGQPSKETGKYAFLSLQQMVNDAREAKLDAIVTAPIDKYTIHSEEFDFPGHTEYLTEAFGASNSLMMLSGESFNIGVVTGHIPVSEIASSLSVELVYDKIRLMHESLKVDFGIRKPRIAVLGLNPHAGDGGVIGTEEKDIIIPAIERAKEDDILAIGPYPADGFFGANTYCAFDGILAMYHDQGLIPFKMMNFESGVNFTAGLPIVRTSPDHGTAYDIAGKNQANEQSFREAVYKACNIVESRLLYAEVNEDPLQPQLIKEKEM